MGLKNRLCKIFSEEINKGNEIAIYPFGKVGKQAYEILRQKYGKDAILIDNKLAQNSNKIVTIKEFLAKEYSNVSIVLCTTNREMNNFLEKELENVSVNVRNIAEVFIDKALEKKEFFSKIKNLCKVKAVKNHNLVRIGKMADGGYVMLDDFKNNNIAYSFGIANEISWDKEMVDKGLDVFCYDHTIKGLPEEYEGLFFYKEGIAGKDEPEKDLYSMKTILERNNHMLNNNLILKMDVEGAEWEFLKETPSEILSKFSQMTFEMHGLTDINRENDIIDVLEKIQRTHEPVWIHANNHGGAEMADDYIIPRLLEITYVNKREYEFENIEYDCPIDLDSPNVFCKELELKSWGSKS